MNRPPWQFVLAALLLIGVAAAGLIGWKLYQERYIVTAAEDRPGGPAVTQIVSARLAGMRQLKVAQLSGTVQATASDVRALGWLRSDQIVKMPYSVDYFVDLSKLGAGELEWHADTRTLIVDAPDVTVATANTEEGRRTLVRTTGMFVTRAAAEELSRRTSRNAQAKAEQEASSPERMAQAREHAKRAIAGLMAAPLGAAGFHDTRILVTFPGERGVRDGERWDQSRNPRAVLAERR
ncbi:MAG: hypothetical protein JWL91_584 [Sphingomonas bacterium]|jgi:hypothetical protein|nr:DUF4230 domain-containing protein [Sphingomonas bacterium]MDB5688708.1 hypothetical protein [Sphingomonas bacterium]